MNLKYESALSLDMTKPIVWWMSVFDLPLSKSGLQSFRYTQGFDPLSLSKFMNSKFKGKMLEIQPPLSVD